MFDPWLITIPGLMLFLLVLSVNLLGDWMTFYNHRRPHAAHGGGTPVDVYRERLSASGPGLRPDLRTTALVA